MSRLWTEEQVQYELEKKARFAVWSFASEYKRVANFSRPLSCTNLIGDLPHSYALWPIMHSPLDSGTYYAGHLGFDVDIERKTTQPLRFHKEFIVEYSRTFPLKDNNSPEMEKKLDDIKYELEYQVWKLFRPRSPVVIKHSSLEEYQRCRKVQIRQQIPVTNNFVPRSKSWEEFAGFLGFRFDKNLYLLFNEHHK